VQEVEILARDTCVEEEIFFSNRRSSRLADRRFGLQLSAIALAG
jgi:copper oxidase (laccase) domain-containing protein